MPSNGYTATSIPDLMIQWAQARQLHVKSTRYSVPGAEESSYESYDDYVRAYSESDIPVAYSEGDLAAFDICAECGRVEAEAHEFDEMWSYLAAIWPCATATALGAVTT